MPDESDDDLHVTESGRAHGIPRDDIRHALRNPQYRGANPDDEDGVTYLILGPDQAGTPLELCGYPDDEHDRWVIFHAMEMRAKYAHLLPESPKPRRRSR